MRLSRALCAAVADTFNGSHASLEAFFSSCGVKCESPGLSHDTKWKEWLFRVGQEQPDESVEILGNLIEEFMDVPPIGEATEEPDESWEAKRARVVRALEDSGLRYFRFGRILPQGQTPAEDAHAETCQPVLAKPKDVDEVLARMVRGLRRAMHPLTHRRKGSTPLTFHSEYDVQDLLHALLRPWVNDIRPEEFTPSYAGSSTRMDFLLPNHELVIETKIVRDRTHAKKIGDELIIDIDHYRKHPGCKRLWCVIYDPEHFITNADGLKNDLEGERKTKDGSVHVKLFVLA
jgi:REase_DpnII-MboI